MIVDKTKCLKKWGPVMDSLKITDKNKQEFVSVYAEHSEIMRQQNYTQQPIIANMSGLSGSPGQVLTSNSAGQRSWISTPPSPLPIELNILSKINTENKIVIINGLNNLYDKIKFTEPHPSEKFTISIETIDSDLKTSRKNKINSLNGIVTDKNLELRLERNLKNTIISDINERLADGQILYIDEYLIDNMSITVNAAQKIAMEFTIRYDII